VKYQFVKSHTTHFFPINYYAANNIYPSIGHHRRSQWPRGIRHRSTAARLLRSGVRIPLGVWKFVCCVCCVLSGTGLCNELTTRPEESYRLWLVVCDHENLVKEEAIARVGLQSQRKKVTIAGPSGRAIQGVGLRPLAYCDCGFESHRSMGVCYECVVCSHVEVSATSWSLVQRSPTDCGASLYVI
jgi:hypothetical protein